MSIKQREEKTLRSYITRFNKETLSIDEADNKILGTTFTNGLRKGSFCFSYTKRHFSFIVYFLLINFYYL